MYWCSCCRNTSALRHLRDIPPRYWAGWPLGFTQQLLLKTPYRQNRASLTIENVFESFKSFFDRSIDNDAENNFATTTTKKRRKKWRQHNPKRSENKSKQIENRSTCSENCMFSNFSNGRIASDCFEKCGLKWSAASGTSDCSEKSIISILPFGSLMLLFSMAPKTSDHGSDQISWSSTECQSVTVRVINFSPNCRMEAQVGDASKHLPCYVAWRRPS